jgi:hypothetical protein
MNFFNLLIGGKPSPAFIAFPPPPDQEAFFTEPGINDLVIKSCAVGTFHFLPFKKGCS